MKYLYIHYQTKFGKQKKFIKLRKIFQLNPKYYDFIECDTDPSLFNFIERSVCKTACYGSGDEDICPIHDITIHYICIGIKFSNKNKPYREFYKNNSYISKWIYDPYFRDSVLKIQRWIKLKLKK